MKRMKKLFAILLTVSLVMNSLSGLTFASNSRSGDGEDDKCLAGYAYEHTHTEKDDPDGCWEYVCTASNASGYWNKCELEEHEHDDSCYDDRVVGVHTPPEVASPSEVQEPERVLVCEKEVHTHTAATCHEHTSACEMKPNKCGMDEHTHTDACIVNDGMEESDNVIQNVIPIDKKATELYGEDYTDVTLSVPGSQSELGVDIVYIVGSYASNADGTPNVEGDVLISSLVDSIGEIVRAGTPVNFGMVPFSSDNVVAMDLTAITGENLSELPDMISNALATCEAIYDGVNMENALIKSKEMFSESALAEHPERQHLVMITSGFTYFFNSGEDNEYAATVPVNYEGVNRLFYWNKAWQRARTNQTNTYPIPKGIVEAYNAKTDKDNNESLWDFYWSYIDAWAEADIYAGDDVVYEACTIESADFLNWYNSGELVKGYSQTGYGKAIPGTTEEDINKAVTLTAGANPLEKDADGEYTEKAKAAAHAIGYERAMWEAYEYSKENITGAGINFYPIYNALNVNYTNGNWSPASYKVTWTNQYIGHSFVDMLAGGKAVMYEKQGDKTFFAPIKEQILYTCSIGSRVEDYIGYDEKNGNFEFITDANTLILKVGENVYDVVMTDSKVEEDKIIESSYSFTAPGGTEPTFWVKYYYGDGKTTERFIWKFGENVSLANKASLTYKLQLVDKAEEEGTYEISTNHSATLYPKDSEGNELDEQEFPVPEVEYIVPPAETTTEAPSTEPAEPSTESTEPSTESTEPSTEPTEPSTEPTEPSTEPTEPSTTPTEPSTEETQPSREPEPEDNEPETTPQPSTTVPETSTDVITETIPQTEPETLPYVAPDAGPEDIPEEVLDAYYERYRSGDVDWDDIPVGVLGAFFEKGLLPKAVLPATGDTGFVWTLLSIISAIGLALTVLFDRKRRDI